MFRRMSRRAAFLGAALFLVGCSDLPTAPTVEVAPQDGLIGGLVGGLVGVVVNTVDTVVETVAVILSPVLERPTELSSDEVVTQYVGRDGGVIRLPRAGLTVNIPRNALSVRTRITVRAPAGDLYGYEFGPHGLEFDKPVTLTQEVRTPEGGLEVVYFEGPLQPTVEVLEVIPVSATRSQAVFRIEHFSGYALRRRGYVVATD